MPLLPVAYDPQTATSTVVASDTPVEVTNRKISFETLTGKGFEAGDDIIVMWVCVIGGDNSQGEFEFHFGTGATFATRSNLITLRTEPDSSSATSSGQRVMWMDRRTLVDCDDCFFSMNHVSGEDGADTRSDGWVSLVIRLEDLEENVDFFYNEATPAEAISTYGNNGATFTMPTSSGDQDWVFWIMHKWDIGSVQTQYMSRLLVDAATFSEISVEGEDPQEEVCNGTLSYVANVGSGVVARAQYRDDHADTPVQVCDESKMFALRLNRFNQFVGERNTDANTLTPVDTYITGIDFTYVPNQTEDTLLLWCGIGDLNTQDPEASPDSAKRMRGRVQLDGVNITSQGNSGDRARDPSDKIYQLGWDVQNIADTVTGAFTFGLGEFNEIDPTYDTSDHSFIAMSLELSVGPFINASAINISSANARTLINRKMSAATINIAIANARIAINKSLAASSINIAIANSDTKVNRKLLASAINIAIANADTLVARDLDASATVVISAISQTLIARDLSADAINIILAATELDIPVVGSIDIDAATIVTISALAEIATSRKLDAATINIVTSIVQTLVSRSIVGTGVNVASASLETKRDRNLIASSVNTNTVLAELANLRGIDASAINIVSSSGEVGITIGIGGSTVNIVGADATLAVLRSLNAITVNIASASSFLAILKGLSAEALNTSQGIAWIAMARDIAAASTNIAIADADLARTVNITVTLENVVISNVELEVELPAPVPGAVHDFADAQLNLGVLVDNTLCTLTLVDEILYRQQLEEAII